MDKSKCANRLRASDDSTSQKVTNQQNCLPENLLRERIQLCRSARMSVVERSKSNLQFRGAQVSSMKALDSG
jgi:hypothetical protein